MSAIKNATCLGVPPRQHANDVVTDNMIKTDCCRSSQGSPLQLDRLEVGTLRRQLGSGIVEAPLSQKCNTNVMTNGAT